MASTKQPAGWNHQEGQEEAGLGQQNKQAPRSRTQNPWILLQPAITYTALTGRRWILSPHSIIIIHWFWKPGSRYLQFIFCLVALLWTFHILQVQPTGFNYNAQHLTNQTKESDRHFLRGHLGNANQKATIPCKKMGLSNLPSKLGRGCSASFFSKNNEIILSCC